MKVGENRIEINVGVSPYDVKAKAMIYCFPTMSQNDDKKKRPIDPSQRMKQNS